MSERKRGQEEIVGFVLIIVIIAIALLVFLGISLRNGKNTSQDNSVEINQFLESSFQYTTNCTVHFQGNYGSLKDVLKECNSGTSCLNGELACEVFKEDMENILDQGWAVSSDSRFKGYNFTAVYATNQSSKSLVSLVKGNCSRNLQGSTYLVPASPGTIESTLIICY